MKLIQGKGFNSLVEFCHFADIHRNTLRSYLSGEASVFATSFEKMAAALDVDPLPLLEQVAGEKEKLVSFLKTIAIEFPQAAFVLFGSRATDTNKLNSDWDIGITEGPEKLGSKAYLKIKNQIQDFCEDFSHSVDVVNFDQAPEWFLEGLKIKPVWLAGNPHTYNYLLGLLDGLKKAA